MKNKHASVIVNTVHCSNSKASGNSPSRATCVYSIRIDYGKMDVILLHDQKVSVEGRTVTLPFVVKALSIKKEAAHIVCELDDIDLTVKFDGVEADVIDNSDMASQGMYVVCLYRRCRSSPYQAVIICTLQAY